MTVLSRLLSRGEERAITSLPWREMWARGDDIGSSAAVTVDSSTRLVAVYSCIRLLAETVASLPVDSYRRQAGDRLPYRPRPLWLDRPNPEQTRFEFVEQIMSSLLTVGNAYVRPVWSGGDVTEWWVLDPARIRRVYRDGGRLFAEVDDVTLVASGVMPELAIMRAFSLPGQVQGLSPIERARQAISVGLATDTFAGRFFENGTAMSGVIETPGVLTDVQAKELADGFSLHHSGKRAHRPGVLSGGATWKQLSIDPEHAQFLETRQYQVQEIARLFRVPPSMIGAAVGDSMTYANVEQLALDFVVNSVRPWLERLELAFGRFLPDGVFVKWNVEGLLRGDSLSRYQAYEIQHRIGLRTLNELRRLEDLPSLGPEGDRIPAFDEE